MLDAGLLEAAKLQIAQVLLPGQHLIQMTGFSTSLKSLLGLLLCMTFRCCLLAAYSSNSCIIYFTTYFCAPISSVVSRVS